jgi:hypothetical protein
LVFYKISTTFVVVFLSENKVTTNTHLVIMKKVFIIFFGVLAVATSGCRNSKKDAQLEALSRQQDSIRRADQQRIVDLQIKAREDSIAMALANTFEATAVAPRHSAYYVVVGSFVKKSNANSYLATMQQTFDDAQIIRHGRWNYVCVGGQFNSKSSAASTLSSVISQLGGGGSGEEEEEEEEFDEGEATSVDEESEEEIEEDEEDDFGSDGEVGQAWVLGI